MQRLLVCCLTAVWLVAAAGCVKYTHPVVVAEPAKLSVADRNYEAVWQAAIDVLRNKYDFQIDRRDRRAGVITTHPLLGKQFFEFWRRDTVSAEDLAESSLHTVYRVVLVNIRPVSAGSAIYEPIVKVTAVRSNKERLAIGSTGEAYDMFIHPGQTLDAERKLSRRAAVGPGPDDEKLGPFAGLAHRIAGEIRAAAVQSRPRPPSPPAAQVPQAP